MSAPPGGWKGFYLLPGIGSNIYDRYSGAVFSTVYTDPSPSDIGQYTHPSN